MVVSTRSSTVSHRNFKPAFFCSAPGSSCASVSTWKPLQMPDDRSARGGELRHRGHHGREARRARRCGGSRRARTRRARRPRRPRRRVASPCQQQLGLRRPAARPPTRRRARSWCRGTARRRRAHSSGAVPRPRSVTSYDSITGFASSRSHISSTCARRGVGVGRVDDEPDHLADVHLRRRSCSRAPAAPARPLRRRDRRSPGGA